MKKNTKQPFYAMEFVEGKTLRDLIKTHDKLPLRPSLEIIRCVSTALQYALSHGVFHRDIKPDNLLIEEYDHESGKVGPLKIIDFGLAKDTDVDSNLTMEGTGMGTPLYMAPEQVKDAKNVDFRADIYSLGATLFKLLSGHNAATGKSSMEIVANVVKGQIRQLQEFEPNFTEDIYQLIEKMLHIDPKKRFQKYDDLISELDRIIKTLLIAEKKEKKASETKTGASVTGSSSSTGSQMASKMEAVAVNESSIEAGSLSEFGLTETFASKTNKSLTKIFGKDFKNLIEPSSYIIILLICIVYLFIF